MNQSLGSLSYTSNDILVNKQVFNFIINDKHETSLYSNRIKCSIAFDTNFFYSDLSSQTAQWTFLDKACAPI